MQRAADMLKVKVELLQQKNRTKELAAVRAPTCYLAVRCAILAQLPLPERLI
jgi:chromosomal replication initiation ATPase DnaA